MNPGTNPPVTIVGGGPIGLTCALALAHRGIACRLLEARPPRAATSTADRGDRRVIALSRGTLEILEALGVRDLAVAPITDVLVSSSGDFGSFRLRAGEFGTTRLGATVAFEDLSAALARAAAAQPRVSIEQPRRVRRIAQRPDAVELELDDGRTHDARLVVDAEGRIDDGTAPQRGDGRPGSDMALVAEVETGGIAEGVAIERFTRDGPLALLPLPPGAAYASSAPDPAGAAGSAGRESRSMSLVWCMPRAVAQERVGLPPARFIDALNRVLGARMGRVLAATSPAQFPLTNRLRASIRDHRIVYVGNAAQTLHPVAGQGFNLGVRDCVTLAECLAEGVADDCADPMAALDTYTRRRRLDRRTIATITGAMPDLFASRLAPVAAVRSAGLALFGVAAPLRRALGHVLMFGVR